MQINLLEEQKNNEKDRERKTFTSKSELPENKKDKENIFGNFFNFFKKPKTDKKTGGLEGKEDWINLIKEEKKNGVGKKNVKEVDKPVKPNHIKKASKKMTEKKSFFEKLRDSVIPKDKKAKKDDTEKQTEKKLKSSKNIKTFENPQVLKTNLIEHDLVDVIDWGRSMMIFSIFMIFSILILVASYWGVIYWGDKQISQIEVESSEIEKIQNDLKTTKKEATEALLFSEKLGLINSVLDRHVYWTNFFSFLEENTLSDVYYTKGFKGSLNGEYLLNCNTRDFALIEAQVDQFNSSVYTKEAKVTSGKVSADQDKGIDFVNFDLSLKLKPSLFLEFKN